MDFLSIKFLLFLFGSILIVYRSPIPYRISIVFPLLNVLFIFTFINHLTALIPLACFLLAGFLSIRLVVAFPYKSTFIAVTGFVLLIFIYLKKYAFLSFVHFIDWPYLSVGLSYILFRMIQILVDVHQQAIQEKVTLASFFNFCCNFLTFVSGPIQRYQDHKIQEAALGQKALTETEVFHCFSRMIHGLLKVVILATVCNNYHQWFVEGGLQGSAIEGSVLFLCRKFILASLFYALYLYFNFSGYMDIVISFGKLLGFQLPENFNQPFESRSFLDFWTRWHITLADWFKFYVFNPFLQLLAMKWPSRSVVPYLGVIAYFFTFLLMGIWHGSSMTFLIYGLFLGAGVSINKLFDVLMRKYFSKPYNKFIDHGLSGLLGSAFTWMYFSMALSSFWLDYSDLIGLITKLKIKGFVLSFLLGGIICAVVIGLFRLVRKLLLGFPPYWLSMAGNFYISRAWVTFQLLLVIAFGFYGFGDIPDFVYKAF